MSEDLHTCDKCKKRNVCHHVDITIKRGPISYTSPGWICEECAGFPIKNNCHECGRIDNLELYGMIGVLNSALSIEFSVYLCDSCTNKK